VARRTKQPRNVKPYLCIQKIWNIEK
jgi:hypothetical protein